MKNEDKVYLYPDGSMCRVIPENDKNVKSSDKFFIDKKLKIVGFYGSPYITLKDDENKIYYMSSRYFDEYIKSHDITLDSKFKFMTDGNKQSIREVREFNSKWVYLEKRQPELELCMDNKELYAISKPLKIKTYVGCEFIARYKITFAAYDFPINRSVFVIYGLNEDATLDYDKVQYWKYIEE